MIHNMKTATLGWHVYLKLIKGLSKGPLNRNPYYLLAYAFLYYVSLQLRKLLKLNFHCISLPDITLQRLIDNYCLQNVDYIDRETCALANLSNWKPQLKYWWFCSMKSCKKCKIILIPFTHIPENTIVISDTISFNMKNSLHTDNIEDKFFLLPSHDAVDIAIEARISMVNNPYEFPNYIVDTLLRNYFSIPRFLRFGDMFCIDTKEYCKDYEYSCICGISPLIYFKVQTLKLKNVKKNVRHGCFVFQRETTLIQITNIHSYLPQKSVSSILPTLPLQFDCKFRKCYFGNYLPILEEPLKSLQNCILPFIKKDNRFRIKPMFLIKGPQGSGKSKLIHMASESLGLNLYNADFGEIQTLTSAQTEAKLRIVLHNAKSYAPCILYLTNMQVFGKTSEGQKDERILSTFESELNTLYEMCTDFPIIIVAATDNLDLPIELQRLFIETINIPNLNQSQKTDLIRWLLKNKGLEYSGDLSKIVDVCSNLRLADILTLIWQATKMSYNKLQSKDTVVTLTNEDFIEAYEYMQSIYNDSQGVARIPKVYWEDIGGLADLKQEIMRRIQLPLQGSFGFTQSGLLLYGPPGTGKTLLAKAVATEYQLHFMSIKGPEVLNMYVGQSEKNVRQIFEEARAAAPCIIFFDELDSLAPNRGRSGDSGGVMDRVVSQLLAEMDGLEDSKGIFIIGATNRPDLIDPALLRPGRFDKMLYVGIHSDKSSKLSVIKALTRKFKLAKDGNELEKILDHLPENVTGADLYAVCSDAWLRATRRVLTECEKDRGSNRKTNAQNTKSASEEDENIITVEIEDFLEAASSLVPSVTKDEMIRYERMQAQLSL